MTHVKTLAAQVHNFLTRSQLNQAYAQGNLDKVMELSRQFDQQQIALCKKHKEKRTAR